jgi:hypothetical protein
MLKVDHSKAQIHGRKFSAKVAAMASTPTMLLIVKCNFSHVIISLD